MTGEYSARLASSTYTDLALGVYAHSSTENKEGWVFEDVISPVAYCDFAIGWKAQGISVIG